MFGIRFVAGLFKVANMLRALVILVPETFIPLTKVGSSHRINEYFTKSSQMANRACAGFAINQHGAAR
jgi:hypothetical protein